MVRGNVCCSTYSLKDLQIIWGWEGRESQRGAGLKQGLGGGRGRDSLEKYSIGGYGCGVDVEVPPLAISVHAKRNGLLQSFSWRFVPYGGHPSGRTLGSPPWTYWGAPHVHGNSRSTLCPVLTQILSRQLLFSPPSLSLDLCTPDTPSSSDSPNTWPTTHFCTRKSLCLESPSEYPLF